MSFNVSDLTALEILDSRARPTLAVTVRLADGTTARAGVPSGASRPRTASSPTSRSARAAGT